VGASAPDAELAARDPDDVEAPVVEELHDALVPLVADEFVVADAEEVGAEHADLGVVALNKL